MWCSGLCLDTHYSQLLEGKNLPGFATVALATVVKMQSRIQFAFAEASTPGARSVSQLNVRVSKLDQQFRLRVFLGFPLAKWLQFSYSEVPNGSGF